MMWSHLSHNKAQQSIDESVTVVRRLNLVHVKLFNKLIIFNFIIDHCQSLIHNSANN